MTTKICTPLSLLLLIGLFAALLTSCGGSPRRYLAADASLVNPGQTPEEILALFGHPDATRTNRSGQEEWYYYQVRSHFWQRIPFLHRWLGREEVEALQIVFDSQRVIKALYYVPPV